MLKRLVPFVCVAVFAAGCAGMNDYHGPAGWTGTYAGTWDSPSTNESGPFNLTIVDDGGITGNFTNDLLGTSGFVTGKVDKAGNFKADLTYNDAGPTVVHFTAKITRIDTTTQTPGIGGNGVSDGSAGHFPISFSVGQL